MKERGGRLKGENEDQPRKGRNVVLVRGYISQQRTLAKGKSKKT